MDSGGVISFQLFVLIGLYTFWKTDATCTGQNLPIVNMCRGESQRGQRLQIDTRASINNYLECQCQLSTDVNAIQIQVLSAPNYPGCQSRIDVAAASPFSFQCLVSGTPVDTSTKKTMSMTLRKTTATSASDYCVIVQIPNTNNPTGYISVNCAAQTGGSVTTTTTQTTTVTTTAPPSTSANATEPPSPSNTTTSSNQSTSAATTPSTNITTTEGQQNSSSTQNATVTNSTSSPPDNSTNSTNGTSESPTSPVTTPPLGKAGISQGLDKGYIILIVISVVVALMILVVAVIAIVVARQKSRQKKATLKTDVNSYHNTGASLYDETPFAYNTNGKISNLNHQRTSNGNVMTSDTANPSSDMASKNYYSDARDYRL